MINKSRFLIRFWVERIRITTLIVFWLGLMMLSAPNAQAQACGGDFNVEAISKIVSQQNNDTSQMNKA
jgi:hypothetical protein